MIGIDQWIWIISVGLLNSMLRYNSTILMSVSIKECDLRSSDDLFRFLSEWSNSLFLHFRSIASKIFVFLTENTTEKPEPPLRHAQHWKCSMKCKSASELNENPRKRPSFFSLTDSVQNWRVYHDDGKDRVEFLFTWKVNNSNFLPETE